jgi:hypothetical protein
MSSSSPTTARAPDTDRLVARGLPNRRPNLRAKIRVEAIEILHEAPEGLTFTQLVDALRLRHPDRNPKTLNNDLTSLDRKAPAKVCKPAKGLYLHTRFQTQVDANESLPVGTPPRSAARRDPKVSEEKFYGLFAVWLKEELEEVTHAIALGGNTFRDRWGTPDVLGKYEGRRSDVIKGMTSIVAAEIKVDTSNLLTGFGQACAYRLFSHKSYLVIPASTAPDELDRLEALCHMHGIGLVTFDSLSVIRPSFRLLARPVKHEPDLSYTNRYIRHVEGRLFN